MQRSCTKFIARFATAHPTVYIMVADTLAEQAAAVRGRFLGSTRPRKPHSARAPFRWEIHQAETAASIFVSSDRFRSMEAAHTAGMARLEEFIPANSSGPERWRGPACAIINEQGPIAPPAGNCLCPDLKLRFDDQGS
jgi:hypothetical protein